MDIEDIWAITAIILAVVVVGWSVVKQWRICSRDIRAWRESDAAWARRRKCELCGSIYDPLRSDSPTPYKECSNLCFKFRKEMKEFEREIRKVA